MVQYGAIWGNIRDKRGINFLGISFRTLGETAGFLLLFPTAREERNAGNGVGREDIKSNIIIAPGRKLFTETIR
jgi:hypothetical protein